MKTSGRVSDSTAFGLVLGDLNWHIEQLLLCSQALNNYRENAVSHKIVAMYAEG